MRKLCLLLVVALLAGCADKQPERVEEYDEPLLEGKGPFQKTFRAGGLVTPSVTDLAALDRHVNTWVDKNKEKIVVLQRHAAGAGGHASIYILLEYEPRAKKQQDEK